MDARSFVPQPLPPRPIPNSQFPQLPPHQISPQQFQSQQIPQQPIQIQQPLQQIPQPGPQAPPPTNLPLHQPPTPKRRRTSGAGSRGVSNLTPEQLAKKRANDREAQRAIRERTKGQIENLEKKIQELTSQKPYQELQDAIRQKEIVEGENQEIKRRLTSIQGLIQPLLSSSSDICGYLDTNCD